MAAEGKRYLQPAGYQGARPARQTVGVTHPPQRPGAWASYPQGLWGAAEASYWYSEAGCLPPHLVTAAASRSWGDAIAAPCVWGTFVDAHLRWEACVLDTRYWPSQAIRKRADHTVHSHLPWVRQRLRGEGPVQVPQQALAAFRGGERPGAIPRAGPPGYVVRTSAASHREGLHRCILIHSEYHLASQYLPSSNMARKK